VELKDAMQPAHERKMFSLFKVIERKDNNIKYRCIHPLLHDAPDKERQGWGKDFVRKATKLLAEVDEEAAAALTEACKVPAPRNQSQLAFPKVPMDMSVAPTLAEINKQLAKFVVENNLPANIATSQELQTLVNMVAKRAVIQRDRVVELCSPRHLVEKCIEGPDGILAECVTRIVQVLEPLAKSCSLVVNADGATDTLGQSLQVVLMQAKDEMSLMGTVLGRLEACDADFYTSVYATAAAGACDLSDLTLECHLAKLAGEALDAPAVGSVQHSLAQLQRLAQKYTMAAVGDNATAVRKGLQQLYEKDKIVPMGCQAHAFSNVLKHFMRLLQGELLEPAAKVVELFRINPFRQMLRETARGGESASLKAPSNTRFHYWGPVLEQIRAQRKALYDVVNSYDYKEANASRNNGDIQKLKADVKTIVTDDRFFLWTDFSLSAFNPLIRIIRLFDSSAPFAISLVRPLWDGLFETFALIMGDERFRGLIQDNRLIFADLVEMLERDRARYHFDTYDVAWFLSPLAHEQAKALDADGDAEFEALLDKSADLLASMYCRMSSTGVVREQILDKDNEDVVKFMKQAKKDVKAMILGLQGWEGVDFGGQAVREENPFDFLCLNGPSKPFKMYAARLLTWCPSTAIAERAHKKIKANHTPASNRLGYVRNLGRTVIHLEMAKAAAKTDHGMTWLELVGTFDALNDVSAEGETNIAWTVDQFYTDKPEAEDSDKAATEAESGSTTTTASTQASPAACSLQSDESNDAPVPSATAVEQVRTSRSGRRLKAKFDEVFVRLDEDGGLPD